jgi:hypothetical protein
LICLDCLDATYYDDGVEDDIELSLEFKILNKLCAGDYSIIRYDEDSSLMEESKIDVFTTHIM